MNIIDIQDQLKNFSEQQLISEMQTPTGSAPQFLVLSEIKRRKRVRDDFMKREAANQPTVAEEAVAAAGVPQSGIMGMSEAMAPQAAVAEGGIGSVMPQSMRPQTMPAPTDDAIPMRSGGLAQFGQELSQKVSSDTVEPFLDEVESMASDRFGVDLGDGPMRRPPFMGRIPRPRPLDSRQYGGLDILSDMGRGGSQMRPAVMDMAYRGGGKGGAVNRPMPLVARPVPRLYAEGGVVKAANGLPLGLRQNNPGNIRPGAGFIGETGQSGGYAEFGSEEEGLRALARLLGTYSDKYGINTLRGLTSRYAPRSDNKESFDNYVSYLSDRLGMDPDQEFDLKSMRGDLIPAIVGFEQGREFGDRYSDDQISRAITAAGTDDEAAVRNALFGVDPRKVATVDSAPETGAGANVLPSMPSEDGSDMGTVVQDGAIVMPPSVEPVGPSYFEELSAPRDEVSAQMPTFSGPTVDESGGTQAVVEDGAIVMKPGPIRPDMVADPNVLRPIMPDFASGKVRPSTNDDDEEVESPVAQSPADNAAAAERGEGEDNVVFSRNQTSGATSSLEQEILDLQKKMEKDRDTDKYLALAQAGLALMSSKEPTLLGAIGEAGVSGLQAYREAQDRYNEGVVDLINARAKLNKGSDKDAFDAGNAVTRLGQIERALGGADGMTLPDEDRARLLQERLFLQRFIGIPELTTGATSAAPAS